MPECPLCGTAVKLEKDAVQGEIIECPDCGAELELTSITPATLAEAPQEEEDWGE